MTATSRPSLNQSPLLFFVTAIATGILIAHYLLPVTKLALFLSVLLSGSGVATSIALLRATRIQLAAGFLVAAFGFAGVALSLTESANAPADRLSQLYQRGMITRYAPVELTGTVQGQPEIAPQGLFVRLQAERISYKLNELRTSGTVLLLAHFHNDEAKREYDRLELHYGARVRVMTTLDREDTYRNPGVLPLTEYLERNDYEATGVIKSPLLVERLDDDRVFLPLAWLYDWREKLQTEFVNRFSSETAGVLGAALLGNRYGLSHSAADRFRAGGTFHVLVISGMHISFIGGLVFVTVGWFTRRRLWQFLIAATFLWTYTVAVGADAPVVRAALMFTLVMFASIVWRRANSLNVIGGTALALLVWQPSDLFDPSFQLTFLSVLAIVLLAVPILRRMQSVGSWQPTLVTPYPPECPRWFRNLSEALFWSERAWHVEMAASNINYRLFKMPLAEKLERSHVQKLCRFGFAAIVVSASVQVVMLPVMIIYFHRLSFAALVLNIFVGVLMAAVGILAIVAVMVAQISAWPATPFVLMVEKLNWVMIHAVDPFMSAGLASVRLPHYSGWPAVVYLLYFLPLALLVAALARWDPLKPFAFENPGGKGVSRQFVRVAFGLFIALVLTIVIHPFSAARPDRNLHVDFLDVGQGDSALLTMPDGTTLLIDGGGHPNIDWNTSDDEDDSEPFQRDTRTVGEAVVSEYLWSRGLDRVDYVLATHADADHIDGLNDIVRNFKVRGAIVARTPRDDRGFANFAESLQRAGVALQVVGQGDSLQIGNITMDVLWPPQIQNVNSGYRNNDGLVLRVRCGQKSLLFAADIEKEVEGGLQSSAVNLRSDVVKVAHHGSRTSSTQPFVDATRPQLAIISVGRTSIFGHPHREVVERWRASGAQVMTTGEYGTISIVSDGRALNVISFVKAPSTGPPP